MATEMRNPASETVWKGREHHRAVLSCSFALPRSDLNISQICSHPGRAGASLGCADGCVGSPRLNQGSQACSLFPAALTPTCQVGGAAADGNTHHQLKRSYHHTGNGALMGTALLELVSYPRQGLSAALVCCPEPSSGLPVTDLSPSD